MSWPQWTVICILILQVWVHIAFDKKPKSNPNFDASTTILEASVWALLLYAGGFWS